ncbi:uncharacterized protein LOC123322608 [Coccinella septempunctata]|uniref:uncharacterized protein LOC123322608 n=1 Tax=Coccinella septempunctata TaxID=41139 RepID=UPI001D06C30C|nr:uncharacterized protein LOC123322608 [Coccinella septempunctata]
MGLIAKKRVNAPEKPIVVEAHEKTSTSKNKVHRNATDRIPPVIQETTEEDNSSNHKKQDTEIPIARTDQSMKTDGPCEGKSSDSTTRNSYIAPETGHSSRRNGNNISVQNRNITRTNSVPNSVRSTDINSSVQSLTVIREQYCCCSKWSRCERILGLTVGIMAIIIVILIVVIGILSSNSTRSNFSGLSLAL